MVNLFKFDKTEFLGYGDKMEFPQEYNIEIVKENVDISEYPNLPLMSFDQLILRLIAKRRTPDKILSENGIETFQDLAFAHFCIMQKVSSFSKSVRDLIEQKYNCVSQWYNPIENNLEESN